ncbi:MAG: V-type ATPase subunit [Coriobacteriia bacterium]|nr:V-type ATPase subunit [Coriobacteriia bacterium]
MFARAIGDPLRYGYAVGRVRVLEARLLGRSTYERLADAPAFEDQKRILSETVYGGLLERAHTSVDVELALDRALEELYVDLLERSNLPEPFVSLLRVQHDYDNLKAKLRAEALGIPIDEMLEPLGRVPAEAFGPTGRLTGRLAETEAAARASAAGPDGQLMPEIADRVVDAAMLTDMRLNAEESGSAFLRDLVRLLIDSGNVRVFVRGRARELTAAAVWPMLPEGGSLERRDLAALYRLPLPEAVERLARAGELRRASVEKLVDPERTDVALDTELARFLHRAHRIAVGPEPVLAYVMSMRSQNQAVRTLLLGKLAGVSVDVLRGRMRETVV